MIGETAWAETDGVMAKRQGTDDSRSGEYDAAATGGTYLELE